MKKHFNEKREAHTTNPPVHPEPVEGGWRGWPTSRAGGGLVILGFSSSPYAPSEGGHYRRYVAHFFLDTGLRRYDDIVHRWRGWPASAGRGWTLLSWLYILHLRPLRRGRLLAVCCSLFSGYRPPDFARAGMTTLSVTQGLAKFSGGYKNHVININAKRSEALGGSERLISK